MMSVLSRMKLSDRNFGIECRHGEEDRQIDTSPPGQKIRRVIGVGVGFVR